MRRPLIAGNWKMNLSRDESVELVSGIASGEIGANVDVLVCPTYVYLDAVAQATKDSDKVHVGAQDVYFEEKGAFTGEISTAMVKDIGCSHVILGHSERRHVIGESDDLINKKIKAVLAAGLTPVLCVGELLGELSLIHI